MKKYIALCACLSVLFVNSAFAFRDISENSSLKPAINYLIENKLFEEGTFFKPQMSVTAEVFWPIVLKEAGFNAETSATFSTPLPPNIEDTDPLAQYLREGIRRGFIPNNVEFDRNAIIKRVDAVEILVKTKGIPTTTRTSKAFLNRINGVPEQATYLPIIEAAYASKLIKNIDIADFQAYEPLTRATLAQWLYNYDKDGIKKATLNPRGQHLIHKQKSIAEKRKTSRSIQDKQTESILKLTNARAKTNTTRTETIPRTAILQDVFANILGKYRFPENITEKKKEEMMEAAITAMVKELGDRFTNYVAPAKSKEFNDNLNGKFEGIGAHVEMIEDDFTITAPIKDSPAMNAGILAGDIVTHVDDEDVRDMAIMDIIDKIKGPAGSTVKLTILRDHKAREISVERAQITVPTIDLDFHKGIPVIGVHKFTAETQPELEKILREEVMPKNPKGIVIDMRNDPGGLLTAAVAMGELFTKKGTKLFSINYNSFEREFTSSKDGILSDQENIVVLQNKGTASASEILASIIQDYNIGTIIGTSSMGKGTVQEVINYNTNAILKLTVAKWLTPKGRWIQEDEGNMGVIPNIEVTDPTVEEIKEDIDRQLDTAIRYILDQ